MTTFEHIELIVCQGEGLLPALLKQTKNRRNTELVFARQCIFYLMREFTKKPLSSIGRHFNKDHATVIHSVRTIHNYIDTDRDVKAKIQLYEEKVKLALSFDYATATNDIEIIRKHIDYCLKNKIKIPEEVISEYNRLIIIV
jgi:hypothetical protein